MTMINISSYTATAPTIRRGLAAFAIRIRRLVNRWVATALEHRERQATLYVLRRLGDRELKDIGISRCQISDALVETAQTRERMQQTRRSQPTP